MMMDRTDFEIKLNKHILESRLNFVQKFADGARWAFELINNKPNNPMTIEELKQRKDTLEKELHKHIQDFEEATGMRIENIDIHRVGMVDSNFKQIHGVDTKLNFNK